MSKAPRADWLDPVEFPPPRNAKIRLLTYGNVDTTGHWRDDDCAAWQPLADVPVRIKQRQLLWATGRKAELKQLMDKLYATPTNDR